MWLIDFLGILFFKKKKIKGIIEVIKPEYAFLISEDRTIGDILIPLQNLNFAMDGDFVEVIYSTKRNKDWKYVGKVTKVLQRNRTKVIGVLDKRKDGYLFKITSCKNFYNIDISFNIEDFNKEQEVLYPSRVEAIIEQYPSSKKKLKCKITDIFGPLGESSTEIKTIYNLYNLPKIFPEKVVNELDEITNIDYKKEIARRKDFRDHLTFTIDPLTAKDFDDALSIKQLKNGNYIVGIHIADVSTYVKEGSELDKEAYKRNTSVYLIDRVIPMLPEILCNDLCSLVPNKDRLTMSVDIEIDSDFNIKNVNISESVIHSDHRFTYEEAQKSLDNEKGLYHKELTFLYEVAKFLKNRRIRNGAIDFNIDNVDFSVDESDNLAILPNTCPDSHLLVEEFMLLANRLVAEYASNIVIKGSDKRPVFIYRVNPKPEKWKVNEYCRIMKCFGYNVDNDVDNIASEVNRILQSAKGSDNEHILTMLSIRMMQKAYYSTEPIGHYGLGFKYYSHFSSPIRRYNDIIVHRLLKKYIVKDYEYDDKKYNEKCLYSGEKEKNATEAERFSIKYKQLQYLKSYIGEKVSAIISGLTDWGIFVELKDIKCDGLIRFSNVKDDYLYFDRDRMSVYGKFTGNVYKIGAEIEVIITNCNTEMNIVDLSFI